MSFKLFNKHHKNVLIDSRNVYLTFFISLLVKYFLYDILTV